MTEDITLSPSQIAILNDTAPDITRLKQLMTRAKRAGLPVDDLQKELARIDKMRSGLLKEFGSHASEH